MLEGGEREDKSVMAGLQVSIKWGQDSIMCGTERGTCMTVTMIYTVTFIFPISYNSLDLDTLFIRLTTMATLLGVQLVGWAHIKIVIRIHTSPFHFFFFFSAFFPHCLMSTVSL